MPKTVLVVDDEDKIREAITSYLDREGYRWIEARTGSDAIKRFQSHQIDLIILDLMLPDLSGEAVCRTIRQSSNVPIMMLTANSAEDAMINGLTIGADDYITKPFSPRVLMTRIKVLFRRTIDTNKVTDLTLRYGPLLMDPIASEATFDGNPLPLTPKEFQLLLQMAKSPGRTFRREDLIETVFGFDYEGDSRAIDQHIKNLRSKIEVDPRDPKFIKTIFGVGYQFNGGV